MNSLCLKTHILCEKGFYFPKFCILFNFLCGVISSDIMIGRVFLLQSERNTFQMKYHLISMYLILWDYIANGVYYFEYSKGHLI